MIKKDYTDIDLAVELESLYREGKDSFELIKHAVNAFKVSYTIQHTFTATLHNRAKVECEADRISTSDLIAFFNVFFKGRLAAGTVERQLRRVLQDERKAAYNNKLITQSKSYWNSKQAV